MAPVQRVAPAPTVPDITGLWRTLSGETYHFALQASPDFTRFVGMCQGTSGQFPAQMFR